MHITSITYTNHYPPSLPLLLTVNWRAATDIKPVFKRTGTENAVLMANGPSAGLDDPPNLTSFEPAIRLQYMVTGNVTPLDVTLTVTTFGALAKSVTTPVVGLTEMYEVMVVLKLNRFEKPSVLEGNSVAVHSTKPSENVAVKSTCKVGLLRPVSVEGVVPATEPVPLFST